MEGLYHDTTLDDSNEPKSAVPSPDAKTEEVPETASDSPPSPETDFSASEFKILNFELSKFWISDV